MSSILSMRATRRRYYAGALALALAGVVAIVVVDRQLRRPIYAFSVQECLRNAEKCRNGRPVRVDGALAPGTLRSSQKCVAEFSVQSPGGEPVGAITVCVHHALPIFEQCSSQPGFDVYAARGYLLTQVQGRFVGEVIHADEVAVVACDDLRYYHWLFGLESDSGHAGE
jgi:hypothetical protein